jgi:LysM repeat protein
MNTLREIEYEITLSILGFNPPLGCKIVTDEQLSPFSIKKDLIAAAEKFNSDYSTVPESMPASIADLLNDAISDLSSAINAVTGFVDKVLDTAEDINRSANRALGLIKNARANVSLYTRRVGFLALDVSSLLGVGTSFGLLQGAQRSKLTTRAYTNSKFIVSSISDTNSLSAILARLEAQFKAFSVTVPASRYMVKTGDTLQKLAVKYYNDANQWKRIYDHNKLTSTSLTVGRVLEIPKV